MSIYSITANEYKELKEVFGDLSLGEYFEIKKILGEDWKYSYVIKKLKEFKSIIPNSQNIKYISDINNYENINYYLEEIGEQFPKVTAMGLNSVALSAIVVSMNISIIKTINSINTKEMQLNFFTNSSKLEKGKVIIDEFLKNFVNSIDRYTINCFKIGGIVLVVAILISLSLRAGELHNNHKINRLMKNFS